MGEMSKPEKIPQYTWNAAVRCAETALRNLPDDHGDMSFEIATIARAILAAKAEEREACAQIADPIETDDHMSDIEKQAYDLRDVISQEIRKRGELS